MTPVTINWYTWPKAPCTRLLGPAVSSGHGWLLRQTNSTHPTPIIISGLWAFVLRLWRMFFFLFVWEIMGVRSKKRGGKNYLGWKIERPQCFHNAFCFSFLLPVPLVQPDPPPILTVCLSKRLHGTGRCDPLVDILSVCVYEKKKHTIPMQSTPLTTGL